MMFLAIVNTIMTFGILVGVWAGFCKTDKELTGTNSELKEAIFKLNRFLKDKIDSITDGK